MKTAFYIASQRLSFKAWATTCAKGTSGRQITSPHTNGPENKIAKQPIGQYNMPMGFHQMS